MSTEATVATFERHTYEDPFLDMAATRLPKSYRKLQELCYIFSITHPQIAPIVWRLAEYPITSIVYTGDSEAKRQWKQILEDELGILDRAIEWGLDAHGYGNCFVTVQFPFLRYYQCKVCKGQWPAKKMRGRRFDGTRFTAMCATCKTEEECVPIDQYIRRAKGIRVTRLDPQLMTLKYNQVTGQTFYYYDIPRETKAQIQRSDWEIIDTTPIAFLKCIIANTKMRLNRVFHFKRPTLSGRDMQWGLPLIMPALKDAYLNQIYKKADEQIALEHSVPLRILFPEPGTQDPLVKISMGSFRGFLEQNIRYWRKDKNAILTAPLPIGAKVIGGDHSAYQTIQTRQFVVDEIIGACLVTKGFVMGGEQWSAASVNQRQLENMLLNYGRRLDSCLQWVCDEVRSYLRAPVCAVAMKPFKKVDDIQMLQIIVQLAREKRVSWNEALSRMEIDAKEQMEQMEQETAKYIELMIEELIGQAEAGAKSAVIQTVAQSEAEGAASMLQNQLAGAQQQQQGQQQLGPGGGGPRQLGPAGDPGAQGAKVSPATAGGQGAENGGVSVVPAKINMGAQVDNWARELLAMGPEQMKDTLRQMAEQSPELGKAVSSRASEMQKQGPQPMQQNDALAIIGNARSPEDIAQKLMMMDPQERLRVLRDIQRKNAILGLSVMKAMTALMQQTAGTAPPPKGQGMGGGADMRPQPEILPPRRTNKAV